MIFFPENFFIFLYPRGDFHHLPKIGTLDHAGVGRTGQCDDFNQMFHLRFFLNSLFFSYHLKVLNVDNNMLRSCFQWFRVSLIPPAHVGAESINKRTNNAEKKIIPLPLFISPSFSRNMRNFDFLGKNSSLPFKFSEFPSNASQQTLSPPPKKGGGKGGMISCS